MLFIHCLGCLCHLIHNAAHYAANKLVDTTGFDAVLPVFLRTNLLFQQDIPCIHILHDVTTGLLERLLGRFVRIEAFEAVSGVDSLFFF